MRNKSCNLNVFFLSRFQVVELASLDSFKTPLEKIHAMRNSVDLVIAEVKTALVEASSNLTLGK